MSDKDRINIGDFQKVVTMYKTTREKSTSGQVKEALAVDFRCFAKVEESFSETTEKNAEDLNYSLKITTHKLSKLTPSHIAEYNGRKFNITSFKEVDSFMIIDGKETDRYQN